MGAVNVPETARSWRHVKNAAKPAAVCRDKLTQHFSAFPCKGVGLSWEALPWPQGTRSSVTWRVSQHHSRGTRTVTPYRMARCPGRREQRLGPEIWAIFQGITAAPQCVTPSSLVSTAASSKNCDQISFTANQNLSNT